MNMEYLEDFLKNVLQYFPYSLQQGFRYCYRGIPVPIRYGKMFRDTYRFLQTSQWWSKVQLEEFQWQQMEKLLSHAYENVPYYQKIFNERGLKPKDIQNFDDMQKLPYLTKEIIRDNLIELVSRKHSKSSLKYRTTGGSTGVPLGFYWEKGVTEPKEWAFVWRQWNWAGYQFGEKGVVLKGDIVKRFKNNTRQWWEYNPTNNAVVLSSYDMTKENLVGYIEKIKRFKPVAIQGYPSSLSILANFLKKENSRLEGIRCILTSAETLYPQQREVIEEYLGAQVFDHYGHTERNALIMQCEKQSYHIISEYGIMELIGEDGKPVTQEGQLGELIATGFNNYAMPFIRYKTKDIGVCTKQECDCGRNYPLIKKIEGRLQEVIVTKNKGLITLTGLIFGQHFEAFARVKEMQLVQEKEGAIIIKIVKTAHYSDKDEHEIRAKIYNIVGDGLDIEFDYDIEQFPRTKRGKHKFLVQKLPVTFGGER